MVILKQYTHASAHMMDSAMKAHFGSQVDICDSLGKPASGVRIQNTICIGMMSDALEEDDVIDSREFSTWRNCDVSLFEAFYDEVCELLENNVTGSHNRRHADRTKKKRGTLNMYRFILTADMIREKKDNLDKKGVEYLV